MQVWTGLDQVPGDLGDSAVTIGNFDGVHTGHRQVLQRVVEEAARRSVSPVAVTFHPHPLAVLHPGRAPEIITGRRTRRHLLAGTGLAGLLELEFTPELARHSPRQFVEETFVKAFGAAAVVVGHDVRFGHRNSGDIDMLRVLGSEYGFDVMTMEDVNGTVHGRHADRRWSSSWVRELLRVGDVRAAGRILGRRHCVCGAVVHGDHRGRQLGFPTANLGQDAEGMIPADGIYAGWVTCIDHAEHAEPSLPGRCGAGANRLPAAISVGTNPTFAGERLRRVEAYVLDRTDLDLYGRHIVVEFVELLRPTVRFDSMQDLITQMREDVAGVRTVLAGEPADPDVSS